MRLGFYHWDNSSVFDPYGGNSTVPDFSSLTPTLAQQFVLSNSKALERRTSTSFASASSAPHPAGDFPSLFTFQDALRVSVPTKLKPHRM